MRARLSLPLLVFAISLVILALVSGPRIKQPSEDNHFVYLADSYLHGTLEMRVPPPHGNDWASYDIITLRSGDVYEGIWWDRGERKFLATDGSFYIFDRQELAGMRTDRRTYVSFPPMPAVLMMPGVAIWGMGFNDVWFTLLFAAANCALMFALLRRLSEEGRSRLGTTDNLWLTLMFGIGSNHLWCSVLGSVWFTALVVGVTFTLLYIWFALDAKHPLLAGLFLACGFATRTPILFSVVFFAGFFFFPGGRLRRDWGIRFWRDGLLFAAVPLLVGIALMAANEARFGSHSEFGHTYLANGQIERIKQYGLFNVHFISRNLAAMFALVPKFMPHEPWVQISKHGLALWFTTPALLWLGFQRYRDEPDDTMVRRICFVTIAAIALPHIFYQNTGWVQFGYRFSLDYMAYLTVLLALGQRRLSWAFRIAVLLGVAVNVFGGVTFNRYYQYYADWLLEE